MRDDPIFERVVEIIRPFLPEGVDTSSVHPQSDIMSDLALNSIGVVDVLLRFEDEFRIEIRQDEAERIRSIGDILGLLEGRR